MYPPPGSPPPPGYPPGGGYPPPGYPPGGGYPPPGYPPGGHFVYAPIPVRPSRSGIPRTLGVLAIVFSCFGLLGSAIWSLGPISDIEKYGASDLDAIETWLFVWLALSFGIFVIELVGGILAVQYKLSGLTTLTYYAIGALALILIDLVLVHVLIPSEYRAHRGSDGVWFSVRTMHLVFSFMAAPWPIVALALSRNARAREACGAGALQQAAQVF